MVSLRILFLVVASVGLSAGQVDLLPLGPTINKPLGDIVIVYCQYSGSGTVQPTWRDPDNNIIPESGTVDGIGVTYSSTTKTKLEITSLRTTDQGTYECSTPGGSQSITINYYAGLQFTNAPDAQSFEISTDARVICEVTSNPLPETEWKFNTKPISAGTKYTIVAQEYLEIKNITKDDEGKYICQATVPVDSLETAEIEIEVTVLVPPKITLAPEDFNGTLGKNAEFKCIATGSPAPTYTWDMNGDQITDGGRFSIQEGGEKLVITVLEKADVGTYKCTASVTGLPDKVAVQSAFLQVFIPPTVKKGIEVIARENGDATLFCSTVGGDPSELVWRRFGEDMPLGDQPGAADIQIVETNNGLELELRFSSVKRSYNGSYECFAKNSGGEASELSNLTVQFTPVIDSARNQKEAYTSWIGNPITMTCYWLANPPAMYFWRKVESGSNNNNNLTESKFVLSSSDDGASSVTFTPEENEDFAVYECVAWNTIDLVVGSLSHIIELKSAAPPDAPTVTIRDTAPTTISLRIEAAEYTGGLDLTGYNVTWRFENSGVDRTDFKFYDYKDEDVEGYKNYIIEGLLSAKEYTISVAAVNEYATGQASQEQSERTLSTRIPYKPPITSGQKSSEETEYTVEWEEPEDSGLSVIRYYLQYWKIDDGDKEPIQPIPNTVRQYTISGLEKDTNYRLELWAENSLGNGDRSSIDFLTAGLKITPSTEKPSSSATKAEKPSSSATKSRNYNTVEKMTTTRSDSGHTPATPGSLEKGTIIGIVIAAFLIVLIVVDISCCIVNDCGMTMCLCVHCCGRQAPGAKSHEIEMGEERGNGDVTSQQKTTLDETTPPGESTNQDPNSCDVAANGQDGGAAKGGKVGYSEIREDGDGSAPTDAPVEKDKLMGSETEQAPPLDEKTPMLSDQDDSAGAPAAAETTPAADGDAKSEPPAAEPPAAEPPVAEPVAVEPPATDPVEPTASETPAEPPSVSNPEQNTTDEPETKGGSDEAAE